LPKGPWVIAQTWHDLLFAHWPLPPELLRPLVPRQLELDIFEGQAWVGVVPFRISAMRPRLLPPVPGLSYFPELNVRTYVKARPPQLPKPGVYFFSLDAGKRIPAALGRQFFRLNYFHARMRMENLTGKTRYECHRRDSGTPAEFEASYGPTGPVFRSVPGSLEHWLTERYSLHTVHRDRTYICEIHHLPWPLQAAEAEIHNNTMARAAGIELPVSKPLLHYARHLEVATWPLRREG